MKEEEDGKRLSPQELLFKTLYVINWLLVADDDLTPAQRHARTPLEPIAERPQVMIWNPDTQSWNGPFPLLTHRRGYACVSIAGLAPRWVPAKWIKPALHVLPNTQGREKKGLDESQTVSGEKTADQMETSD